MFSEIGSLKYIKASNGDIVRLVKCSAHKHISKKDRYFKMRHGDRGFGAYGIFSSELFFSSDATDATFTLVDGYNNAEFSALHAESREKFLENFVKTAQRIKALWGEPAASTEVQDTLGDLDELISSAISLVSALDTYDKIVTVDMERLITGVQATTVNSAQYNVDIESDKPLPSFVNVNYPRDRYLDYTPETNEYLKNIYRDIDIEKISKLLPQTKAFDGYTAREPYGHYEFSEEACEIQLWEK